MPPRRPVAPSQPRRTLRIQDRRVPVTVSLRAEEMKAVDTLAAELGVDRSALVREGIALVLAKYRKRRS